ncbi:redoxin domain-containing protein [Stieleria sp. TO1_6]|uniref:redoxin domain-containing protein n=1 Tax=Stieleria tagensis TaxID=2956795 RepID=UPI00209B4745|nr:redoxin domain-containing protein [Stieleria tagensis]MCO8122286.1 redoxin domain-containing protein [Stieleria tagensis]
MKTPLLCLLLLVFTIHPAAADSTVDFGQYQDLIPRNLLRLVHDPLVHQELDLTESQVTDLEGVFAEIDSRWFSSRILPMDQQTPVLNELESRIWQWFAANTKPAQQQRLQQLEYYSQAGRILLRPDVAKKIGLQPDQQASLAKLARDVQAVEKKMSRTEYGDPAIADLKDQAKQVIAAEREGLTKFVQPAQRQKLSALLGERFDTTKLKRIYPMAPEFVDVEHWINSSPLQMKQLRGKVVLVHFYAFQCHNCHANFEIYRRWHRELTDKGVVVIGIQTPETPRERDIDAVKSAAQEREFEFPIVVDLQSENWKAWGNTMWPTVYVVDKNGYIRHWWQGEMNWKGATEDKVIEGVVNELLAEDA